MTGSPTKRGRAGRTNRTSTPPTTLDDEASGSTAAEGRATPAERSRSRSSHRSRHSPGDPRQGGPFKFISFHPKEVRAEAYVNNFEQAIQSYYKGSATDYTKRQHFYEILSNQQRLAVGCMQIGGTYEEMKQSFLQAYGVRKYDILVEMFSVRMREDETVAAFANRFRGLLPAAVEADNELAKFWFLNKLPSELRTRAAVKMYEKGCTFKDLMEECHEAYQQALADRNSKRSRTQVNSVQEEEEEIQEEEEQVAVNWVNHSDNKQQKSKRARTGPRPNAAAEAGQPAATGLCSIHRQFGNKAYRCEGNCIFEGVPGFTIPRPRSQRGRGSGNGRGRGRN